MFKYRSGEVDTRPCKGTTVSGSFVYALMINEDGSTDCLLFDDYEYGSEVREGEPIIDASKEDLMRVSIYEKEHRKGKNGFYAHIGDIIEVVAGRKYPKGQRFTVTGFSKFSPIGTYGHNETYYVNFDTGRIDKNNVIIVG